MSDELLPSAPRGASGTKAAGVLCRGCANTGVQWSHGRPCVCAVGRVVAEAVTRAVAAEREACAAVAEGWRQSVRIPHDYGSVELRVDGKHVAELIRARG